MKKSGVSIQQQAFFQILREKGLPLPVTEYRFHPERQWRADYCWIEHLLILEVEGGVWSGGRHTRGEGFLRDVEKYNSMTVMGYRLLRTTPSNLCKKETLELIIECINP